MTFEARISVFGGRDIDDSIYDDAIQIGQKLARENYLVFCGCGPGVMEAISKGVTEEGGTVVGILKGKTLIEGNEYLSIPIATGMDIGRNAILAYNCDAAVAISGQYGTMSEIAYALQLNKPVIGYKTLEIDSVVHARTTDEVLSALMAALDNA